MNTDTRSDEQLVAAYRRRHADAMEILLARYLDRVRQFVSWKADVRGAEADDLTQEVFLQVFRSIGRFDGRSRFRTWLYGVANNVCLRCIRTTIRRRKVLAASDGSDKVHNAAARPDDGPNALDRLQHEERARAVRTAVAELSPEHRQVLLLAEWEEMSYAEIAQVLTIPVGTVKSRVHHARLRLAGALTDLNRG